MSENFIGEIRTLSFDWAPSGWAACNGQSMPAAQNQALYALLGTQFGGNSTNFLLPDLRSRTPVHAGGMVLNGTSGGVETVTLVTENMPAHVHTLTGSTAAGTTLNATGKVLAVAQPDIKQQTPQKIYGTGTTLVALSPDTVLPDGGSAPHQNLQPLIAVNFCIALSGYWPQRP